MPLLDIRSSLLLKVAGQFGDIPQVLAIALGGSRVTRSADGHSDFDLYIISRDEVPLAPRRQIALQFDTNPEIDNRYFGPEDGWRDEATGAKFDIVYWTPDWLTDQLDRVLMRHEASAGYSTCFWYTVQHLQPLHDPARLLADLKHRAGCSYPEPLRQNIVTLNLPLLRASGSSFLRQIELAREREDIVSVNHRTAAFIASYFDVLFALNRLPHPGEKRLLEIAAQDCTLLPPKMPELIARMISGPPLSDEIIHGGNTLTDGIENLVRREAGLRL